MTYWDRLLSIGNDPLLWVIVAGIVFFGGLMVFIGDTETEKVKKDDKQ